MKYKWLYFLISAVVLVPGVFSLLTSGLNLGIDFTGGSRLEIGLEKGAKPSDLERIFTEEEVNVSSVVSSGEKRYLIKMEFIDEQKKNEIKDKIAAGYGAVNQLRFETVGPLLGRELLIKTLIALILAAILILSYIAWQFRNWSFGICATLATFHDALILLGVFSLLGRFFGFEVDVLFVTALLTILSFSVHDTIVTYDRIRESAKRYPSSSFESLINISISETLVRSLNNSLTVIFMLVALVVLGGATVREFAVALLVGTISGTYSSLFTAAPLLAVWKGRRSRIS